MKKDKHETFEDIVKMLARRDEINDERFFATEQAVCDLNARILRLEGHDLEDEVWYMPSNEANTGDATIEDKNEKIVRECKERNEPYFVLRAQDMYALQTIMLYRQLCSGGNIKPSKYFIMDIDNKAHEFLQWMAEHQTTMKVPD